VRTIEELLEWKSSSSGLEKTEINCRGNYLRWPRNTLYPQKLALTSPTSGGLSFGIVRLQTKATEFSFFFLSAPPEYAGNFCLPSDVHPTYMNIKWHVSHSFPPRFCGHYWPIVPAPDDRWWWLWRNWWNEYWQVKPKYSENTCPSATLSTTNPTWLDPGLNPGRRGGKPTTNRLSYGAGSSVPLRTGYLLVRRW
jgi:hypothetical protein